MKFLNVYNENEKCSCCNEKIVQFIVVETPSEHLCVDCLKQKVEEDVCHNL
jgi:hypothetical protein